MARKHLHEEQKNTVQMVANGAEALTILRDNSVAVFFLELTMPGIEGIEAIGVLQVIQKLKLD